MFIKCRMEGYEKEPNGSMQKIALWLTYVKWTLNQWTMLLAQLYTYSTSSGSDNKNNKIYPDEETKQDLSTIFKTGWWLWTLL